MHGVVTIFYDEPDWAFHNIAANLARIAPPGFSFLALSRDEWFGRTRAAEAAVAKSDIVVFLWRFDLLAYLDTLSEAGWARLLAPDRPALVAMIYDHLYTDPEDLDYYGNPFVLSDVCGACSGRLRDIYTSAPYLPVPAHVVPDGVDTAFFSPDDREPTGPLRIGWVGNSAWGITEGEDFKGRRTILEPAIQILRARSVRFELHLADKAERRLPRSEMPAFYRGIDVLVCSAAVEGTPNPVLEAMASGTAVVSTDVGIVRDVFGPEQRRFILSERSPEALAEALETLSGDPTTLARLRAENLAARPAISWESRWPAWQALFDEARAARMTAYGATVTENLRKFRSRRRTRLERLRRTVAGNRLAFRAYETAIRRFPSLVRRTKRLIERHTP